MLGKKKCKILREIRQKIADENDIPFVTEECRYKSDCKGTCPKCESELRYLEQQLEKRRAVGKAVTVSALALSVATSLGGCRSLTTDYLEGDVPYSETVEQLGGAVAPDETETTAEAEFELEGDVAVTPDGDYDPESNITPPVYGPPETEAPENDYDPGDNVEANIYGPPSMMESVANDG